MKSLSFIYSFAIYHILLLLLLKLPLSAQTNLVLNPSLEDTLRCPWQYSDIYAAMHWYQPLLGGSTTDYFHPCNWPVYSIIVITYQVMKPRTGVAYASIATHSGNDNREYLCGVLNSPLSAGKCYHVQFYVTPVINPNAWDGGVGGSDQVGIYLASDSLICPSAYCNFFHVVPQVEYKNGIICDTTVWTPVRGSFVAKGGEKHFIIGNFKDNDHTNIMRCHDHYPVYKDNIGLFIDDVSVWPCDAPVYEADAGSDKRICYGDAVTLGQDLPDNEYLYLWSANSHKVTSRDHWDTLATTPYLTVKPEQTTTYYLWVRDFKMDITYDSVTVYVDPCITPPIIPNIFTPNGDGFNDVFAFKNHEGWELETCIRNRWGRVVFEGKNDEWWDGTINGQAAEAGVFYYTVTTRNYFGQYEEFHGVVTLLR